MILPAWLFGYLLLGGCLYWALQTFVPHPLAGWIAAGITVVAWYFIRLGRKAQQREAWYEHQTQQAWLASEPAELEERRAADAMLAEDPSRAALS